MHYELLVCENYPPNGRGGLQSLLGHWLLFDLIVN